MNERKVREKKVVVIIPFFQRTRGLLRNALESIRIQNTENVEIEVLVVDDESPISAIDETKYFTNRLNVSVISQKNGGPGSARNTALNSLQNDVDYIAFLDSDDIWLPGHLQRAINAIELGGDFYFANFFQLGQDTGAFERAGRLNINDHEVMDSSEKTYLFKGDFAKQIITGNLIGTPTVVFRKQRFDKVRFRQEFRRAGEDYLFWLDCSRLTQRIFFSTEISCRCGEGVNVFSGAKWGTMELAERLIDELNYKRAIYDHYADDENKPFVAESIVQLKRNFMKNALSMFKQMKINQVVKVAYKYLSKK